MNSRLVGIVFGCALLVLVAYGYRLFINAPNSANVLVSESASNPKIAPPNLELDDKQSSGSKEGEETQLITESSENISPSDVMSMFSPGYTTAGTSSTSVANPGKLYSLNIESAKEGDAAAAYNVWKALNSCKGALPASVLEQGKASGELPDCILDHNIAYHELCAGLTSQVRYEDLRAEASSFLASSAEGGNSHAKLQLSLSNRPYPTKKDIEFILSEALHDPDHLVFDAATSIQAEYYEYDESKVGGWRLLTCQNNGLCDLKIYKTLLEQELYPYQYEEALGFLEELNVYLSSGDTDGALALMKG